MIAILLVFFWNTNHKLICAPSAGYLLLKLKQGITEIYINCAYYGYIIGEISTEKKYTGTRPISKKYLCVVSREFSHKSLI